MMCLLYTMSKTKMIQLTISIIIYYYFKLQHIFNLIFKLGMVFYKKILQFTSINQLPKYFDQLDYNIASFLVTKIILFQL